MILNLISQKNFITFNKVLAKKIGLEEALVLGQVCSLSNLFNDKEFYFTYAEIEAETCLTEYAVKKAVQHLIELKILSMTRKGCPCRNWYSINEDMILSLLESRIRSSSPYEIGGTSGSENEGTSTHEIEGTFKKEMKKEMKEKNNNSAKAETEKFPKDFYDNIYNSYFENCKKLYSEAKIPVEKPAVTFKAVNKRVKESFINFGYEKVLIAVKNSINHKWLVGDGYKISSIFGPQILPDLINGTYEKLEQKQRAEEQPIFYEECIKCGQKLMAWVNTSTIGYYKCCGCGAKMSFEEVDYARHPEQLSN